MVLKDRTLSTFGGFWLFAGRLSHINPAMIQLVRVPKSSMVEHQSTEFHYQWVECSRATKISFFSHARDKKYNSFFY